MNHDGEKPWPRQLLVAVGALLAVALVIGGVVSAFALGAARVSGIDDATGTSAQASTGTPAPSPRASPTERTPIALQVEPTSVQPGQRINLTGDYRNGDGALLQVQRLQGGWTDFPVTIPVDGGRFSTYIQTSRTGDARFRVVDKGAGRSSNVVRVTIG
jgi:hypothetical protein